MRAERVLEALETACGAWVSSKALALAVYGFDGPDECHAVSNHVYRLRKREAPQIEVAPQFSGLGYRLPAPGGPG